MWALRAIGETGRIHHRNTDTPRGSSPADSEDGKNGWKLLSALTVWRSLWSNPGSYMLSGSSQIYILGYISGHYEVQLGWVRERRWAGSCWTLTEKNTKGGFNCRVLSLSNDESLMWVFSVSLTSSTHVPEADMKSRRLLPEHCFQTRCKKLTVIICQRLTTYSRRNAQQLVVLIT